MNVFKSIIWLVKIVLIISFFSCDDQFNTTSYEKLLSNLDSLKSVYAPDTRVALWDLSTSVSSNKISLTGEIDNHKAYMAINNIIKINNSDVENGIKLLPVEGNEQIVTALVNNSVANLRSNPRHSAEIATQALLGTPLRILKKEKGWYLVQTPRKYIAWVDASGIVPIKKQELDTYKASKKIIYNRQYGFSYSEPSIQSQTVTDLVVGSILPVVSNHSEFYQVQYPDKRLGWVKKEETMDFEMQVENKILKEDLVKTAKKFVGIPYLWGGASSKAIDCSGFTSMVYLLNGLVLQRDASQQIKYGKEIATKYDSKEIQIGDLLFFGKEGSIAVPKVITHVGMYIGDSEFIHASGRVKINSFDSTRANFISEYVTRFVSANRIVDAIDEKGIQLISNNDFYKEILQ